jgi:hypothetical protein
VVSVVNLGNHWGAFFVDKNTQRCFLFNPMQLPSNIAVLELLPFGATPETWVDYWDDSLYEILGVLRMMYLHKILRLQSDCTGL